MARCFHPQSDTLVRAILVIVPVGVGVLILTVWRVEASSYVTDEDMVVQQPVPFSHEHHVSGLGLECRYCHTSVTQSAFAGMPSTRTCMTCHSQIWTTAPILQPIRDSWRDGVPIAWNRVHRLPGFVYFDHSAHVNKGVGCSECHGRVDQMPLVRQATPMTMAWCLDCHRDPAARLRPREEVFNMAYTPPPDQRELGRQLCERYEVRSAQALSDCTTCHR